MYVAAAKTIRSVRIDRMLLVLVRPGVMDTATLLFQRCYEYRDEIRDELE
jgi:hypothetical protein